MKTTLFLFATILFTYTSTAQDTIRGQVVRKDTLVEYVRVDTIYAPPPAQVQVQEDKEPQPQSQKKASKVYYGGHANFSFGNYTVIGIEPLIAYKLLPKLSVGGKLSYEYFKNKNYSPSKEGSNYGIGAFSRLRIRRMLYAHVEFSEMNYKLFNNTGDTSERQWISFLYIGGGISKPISKSTSLNAEVLWDVLQDENSPYKTVEPIINIGVSVGF